MILKELKVNLNQVEDVKQFTEIANKFDMDIIVRNINRKFAVDAKSIMGVLSLNLSEPVLVCVDDSEDNEESSQFVQHMQQFLV